MNARTPDFRLVYEAVDITIDVSEFLTDITYVDYLHGKSDTLSFTVEDVEDLWKGPWRPSKGNTFNLEIGYVDEARMPSGSFVVDEIEHSGPPDIMQVSGLAAAITRDLRTKRSRSFEDITLRGIAEQIASEHALVLFGDIPDIRYERKTQNDESDVQFLKRLAEDYALAFTVRDRSLIFHDVEELERETPVFSLDRLELKRHSLKDKARDIYKAAEIQYRNPQNGEFITFRYEAPGIVNGDTLILRERVENLSQAEARARGALIDANRGLNRGSVTIEGEPRALSGNVFRLTGYGMLTGNYLIEKAHHTDRRAGGYVTKLDVRRVG